MHIQVIAGGEPVADFRLDGPVSVGRQSKERNEPGPFCLLPPADGEAARLIIASCEKVGLSRNTAMIGPTLLDGVKISNPSRWPLLIRTPAAQQLEPQKSVELTLPLTLVFPGLELKLSAEDGWRHFDSRVIAPQSAVRTKLPELPALSGPQLDELVRWMQHTVAVFQSTLVSSDFIAVAAEALVNIVRVDCGRVFLLRGDEWVEETRFPAGADALPPSGTVFERVSADRRTFWKVNAVEAEGDGTEVLRRLSAVVAAPIMDADEQVVGVLYGERRVNSITAEVGKPEALLVEMLACGVATGLSRQRQEAKAEQAEQRFAQFFGPALAADLSHNPNLLDSRGEKVSMVFADIRGFSRVSERLSPSDTVQWLRDVMSTLTEAVADAGGLVVDYVGDEMVAMWGAPKPQPDHAARATRAALAMLAALPAVNSRWASRIGEACRLGIGVSTGLALVGNIGSTQKYKYGALGNTVNLGSRVQGLTRYLKLPLLVSGETRASLGTEFLTRRVCTARVVNIIRPLELFEVVTSDGDPDFFRESEAALTALEGKRFPEAARLAGELLGRHPGDGPLQLILSRAAAAILEDGKGFDPVWTPPGK